MDETPSQAPAPVRPDPLVRAVRNLTKAVWVVAAAILLQLGYYVFAYSLSMRRMVNTFVADAKKHGAAETSSTSSFTSYQPENFEGKQFHELTNEKRIKYASVILLTKHVKDARGKTKSMISEIVKKTPGTELHFKVGEEFPMAGPMGANEECAGDGEIVLMVGSPAEMRESSSYTGDRLDSMGGMTLAELRELSKGDGK